MTKAGSFAVSASASSSRSPLRRVVALAGDLAALTGLILCVPLAIVAIGAPIALLLRLVLWIAGVR